MKRAGLIVAAFAAMVAAIEALHVMVAWWKAGLGPPGAAEWLALAALAIVGVLWWRISIFGQKAPRCLMPDRRRDAAGSDSRR